MALNLPFSVPLAHPPIRQVDGGCPHCAQSYEVKAQAKRAGLDRAFRSIWPDPLAGVALLG